jgi:hypothetical protein
VTTPNHAENTGDNLRHVAEVQEQAKGDDSTSHVESEETTVEPPLPDFNT